MSEANYSKTELMICVAARLFEDGATCFIGTGIPMLAAMLAAKTTAPEPGAGLRVRRYGRDHGRAAPLGWRSAHLP